MTASSSAAVLPFGAQRQDIASEIRLDFEDDRPSLADVAHGPMITVSRLNGLSDWQIKKITRHIDENIRSSLRIADLGMLVHLSASHFSRNFKVSFGEPPYAYVLSRRIALAKHLIGNTDEPLSQIAHACGMSDQAHLCKLFRRMAGTTPHQWRQHGGGAAQALC
jgi:AraC-like DNA-binding protein